MIIARYEIRSPCLSADSGTVPSCATFTPSIASSTSSTFTNEAEDPSGSVAGTRTPPVSLSLRVKNSPKSVADQSQISENQ